MNGIQKTKFFYFLSFFIFIALPHVVSADTTTGLVGYWNFDAGSGTTAADSSGNNNIGTLTNGPTWTTGKNGGALSFDGVNDYVVQNNASSFSSNDITMSAWIKPSSVSSTQVVISSLINGGSFYLSLSGNQLNAYWSGGAYHITSNANLTVGNWYHIVAVISTGNKLVTIYLNGTQILSEADPYLVSLGGVVSQQLFVGSAPGQVNFFNGAIDDVKIYSRAFSASDAAELFTNSGGSISPSPSPTPPPPAPSPSPSPSPTPSPTPNSPPPAGTLPTTAGWYDMPNTKLRTVCPPDNFGGTTYDFSYRCQSVVSAWSSAVMDTTRNRLIVWGGGHNDYYGNEIYAVNLNGLTIQRLNNPSLPPNFNGSCTVTALVDGSANGRHTYDGIAYMPNIDRMFVFGGATSCPAGGSTGDTWTFDFATMKWHSMNPLGTLPSPDPGIVTAYDPNTGKIFLHDNSYLYTYDYSSNAFTKVGAYKAVDYHLTGVIDPVRKKFVMMGNGQAWIYDISAQSTYVAQHLTTTGGDAIINTLYPGLAYDSVAGQIVGWSGGDTVYKLNLDTGVWTPETFAGGPGSAQSNGTYKRWSYAPALDAFVLVNNMNQDAFVYRLSSSGSGPAADFSLSSGNVSTSQGSSATNQINSSLISGSAQSISFSVSGLPSGAIAAFSPTSCVAGCSTSLSINTTVASPGTYSITVTGISGAVTHSITFTMTISAPISQSGDFTTRCAAAGVVKCVGFDSASDFNIGGGGTNGAYGMNSGIQPPSGTSDYTRATQDTTQKASGNSSLKFTIPSLSNADTSGSYFTNFSSDLSTQFGAGDTFYVQWRQKFSPEFLTSQYQAIGGGNTGWKQVIVTTGDTGTHYPDVASSCTAIGVISVNEYLHGFPIMYNSCTGSASHGPYDGFYQSINGGNDFKLENARPSPYCLYSQGFTSPTTYFPPNGNCFGYFANEWMTFQEGFVLGPRVGDEFVNSYVQLWVAREGGPSELVVNWGPYNLSAGSPSNNERFGKIWLLPYMTNKDPTISYPVAYTWYDDLIISRNKIADPNGSAPSSTPPPSAPVPDTTPPTVSLTTPTNGSTLSGSSAPLSAIASDNIAVAKVSFRIDTTNIIEDTELPYAALWNTTLFGNGTHTIYVTATDSSGNTTTNQITVTVNNTAPVTPPPTPPVTTPPTPPPPTTNTTPTYTAPAPASSTYIPPALSLVPSTAVAPQTTTSGSITLTHTLSLGSRDSEVLTLQNYLVSTGYLTSDNATGYFGNNTRTAVQKYQCTTLSLCSGDEGTTGYGMVGSKTRLALSGGGSQTTTPQTQTSPQKPTTTTTVTLTKTLYIGTKNSEVTLLQNFLITTGYLLAGNNTGFFGNLTRTAVRKYQCEKMQICSGSEATNGYGVVGKMTRAALQKQ